MDTLLLLYSFTTLFTGCNTIPTDINKTNSHIHKIYSPKTSKYKINHKFK